MKHITQIFPILILFIYGNGLFSQSSIPVAVNDTMTVYFDVQFSDTTIFFNVAANDFDPDGDEIEIAEVFQLGFESALIPFSDTTIDITFVGSLYNFVEQVFFYRIRKVEDTAQLSNWAHLYINPGFSPDVTVARNDTVTAMRGYPIEINVLRNDFHPMGDSVHIIPNFGGTIIDDSTIRYNIDPYYNEKFAQFHYVIADTNILFLGNFDVGKVYIQTLNNEFYDSLDINNINARFNCFGNHFWNMDSKSHFYVPNGSNISSIFSQSFWIGGLDENENLHIAAERYRQVGEDYWPGPVSDVYDSVYDCRWLHVWKLNREEIEFHKAHWWEAGYEPLFDIATWPGNGDIDLGQSEMIAPFEDQNSNGIYEPLQGDAPFIKGDQALYFVFNDDRDIHTETGGVPLGIEIRAMAYAFDMPEDSALWNTIFLHYEIENRSDTNYNEMYLGVFTDTDLGFPWNDFVESDVENGMYFSYNGTEDDQGSNENPGYGEHPPAQGIQFLGGPHMEPDGMDNPKYDGLGNQIVDESINGLNFGDGIVDNERLGMTGFLYSNSGGASWMNDPQVAPEYYNFLQIFWNDNTKLQYGGNGHPTALAVGPDCNFMFPRDSDPYNWGTFGLWPNGGFNQNGLYWSDETTGNIPSDRRGMGSIGPLSLSAGQIQSLDLAYPWARDYEGTAWSSALLLKERAAYIKEMFENDKEFFSRVKENKNKHRKLLVYPNPADNFIRLQFSGNHTQSRVEIIDNQGILITRKEGIFERDFEIDIHDLNPGLYFIRYITNDRWQTGSFIKL